MSILKIIFILIFISIALYSFLKITSKVNFELPKKTLKVAGKIFSESKNTFEHEIFVTLYQEQWIILVGEQSEERFKIFKSAIIVLEKENTRISVYIDTLRVGYLNKINSLSFINFLTAKGFLLCDAFEVDAVIISSLIDKDLNVSTWCVRLDIPYNMQKFRFERY